MSKKKDSSPVVPQRTKFKDTLNIKEFNWTPKQIELIDLILNRHCKVLFLNGPAGTSKTLLAVYCGLVLLNEKKCSDIIYARTVIESASKGMGFLPGEAESKFAPFMMPLEDKLDELLSPGDVKKLKDDHRLHPIPVNFLRGASFNAKVIIADEAQNFDFKELTTLITRLGKFSKMIICGDTRQSDLNGKTGFKPMFDLFDDEQSRNNGIYTFEFGIQDVMRSEEVKYILEKLDTYNNLIKDKKS